MITDAFSHDNYTLMSINYKYKYILIENKYIFFEWKNPNLNPNPDPAGNLLRCDLPKGNLPVTINIKKKF